MRFGTGLLWLTALCAGCSSPPTTNRVHSSHTCTDWVGSEAMCGAELTLFEDVALERPIITIAMVAWLPHLSWRMPAEQQDRAEAAVLDSGFELSGWAPLAERRFEVRTESSLSPDMLHAGPGVMARVLGRSGSQLEVALETSWRAPDGVRSRLSCDALGPSERAGTSSAALPLVAPREDRLVIHDRPDGADSIAVTFYPGSLLQLHEERGGWVRVTHGGFDVVAIDGWVEGSSIERDPEVHRESGCDPPDFSDSAPQALVEVATHIEVGPEPGRPSRLRVTPGAEVMIVDRRDGYSAIEPATHHFGPPPGSRFWIRDAVLRTCDDGACR